MQDLAGLGAVVGHLKDLLVKILELAASRERRHLENEALRIENARKRLRLMLLKRRTRRRQ